MDTKSNSKYWEQITAYFSNDLSEEGKERIESWADDQDAKTLLTEMSEKMKKVDIAGQMYTETTDLAWNKLHNRLIMQEKGLAGKFMPMRNHFIGIVASIIVLLSIGFGIFKLWQNGAQMNDLKTAYNQNSVALADGTIVHLNGNSTLEFPSSFRKKNRTVRLSGEAYFDVKPDKNHPFVIETDYARIQVLGTSFNVKSYNSQGDVEVLVTSGTVRLQDIQNPGQDLILEKGDFATLKDNKLQNKPLNDVNYLAWQTKMLNFNKTPLSEVVQILNRTYAVQIDLAEDKLGELRLTSKYNQMSVDALLDAMCLTFRLDKRIENNKITLYSQTP